MAAIVSRFSPTPFLPAFATSGFCSHSTVLVGAVGVEPNVTLNARTILPAYLSGMTIKCRMLKILISTGALCSLISGVSKSRAPLKCLWSAPRAVKSVPPPPTPQSALGTGNPREAACLPSSCQLAVGVAAPPPPLLSIPLPKV